MTNGKPKPIDHSSTWLQCNLIALLIILLEIAFGLGYLIIWALASGWPN